MFFIWSWFQSRKTFCVVWLNRQKLIHFRDFHLVLIKGITADSRLWCFLLFLHFLRLIILKLLPCRDFHLVLIKGITADSKLWCFLLFITVRLNRARWRASVIVRSIRTKTSSQVPVHNVHTKSKKRSPSNRGLEWAILMQSWKKLNVGKWYLILKKVSSELG